MNSTDLKWQVLPPYKEPISPKVQKSLKELRKFGFVMAAAFGIFGLLFLWREKPIWYYLIGLSGFFLFAGLIYPRILQPIEWAWMKMAQFIGSIMTRVILTLTFFIVITPLGLLMRIFAKKTIDVRFRREAGSYWVPVEEDGPTSRPDKPY